MKKNLLFMLLFLFVAAGLQAVPIQCPTTPLMSTLILLGTYNPVTNTGGCAVKDKIFDNFAYTGSDPTSDIQGEVVFGGSGSLAVNGWLWTNINPTNLAWVNGFTLSYTIREASGNGNIV